MIDMRPGGNTEVLKASSEAYREGVAYYKERVAKVRKNRKYGQEFAFTLYNRMKDYVERVKAEEKPITVAGIILATGVPKQSFIELRSGKFDYDLEVFTDFHELGEVYEYDGMPCCDVDGQPILLVYLSEIIEKAMLMMEEETETRLYEKGRVGDIFALKAKHGWIEEEKAPRNVTNNNTLVIASEGEARKALEMLK